MQAALNDDVSGIVAEYDEDDEKKPAVVIDNGSYTMKAGCSGEDAPKVTFRTCVGWPTYMADADGKSKGGWEVGTDKDHYVGEEAMWKRGMLHLKYPIEGGVVQNWDRMEQIWRHTFDDQLRMVVGDENEGDEDCAGVLMTEGSLHPKEKLAISKRGHAISNRERMTEIMFETFGVRRFYVAPQTVLSLYASGRTTGLAVDCGDGVSQTVPIYEGYPMPHAIQRINLAGRDLTDYICKILQESKITLTTTAERESAKKIKEDLCYCSMNFSEEVDAFAGKEKQFEMPDGTIVTVHNQLIRVPELMFKPSLAKSTDEEKDEEGRKEMPGLHDLTYKAVMDCDADLRNELLNNIIMSGGSSMFPNMPARPKHARRAGQ